MTMEDSHLEEGLTLKEQVEGIDKDEKSIGKHHLDKDPQTKKYFRLIRQWVGYEFEKQAANRAQRMKAHNYKDGEQWEQEEKAEVEARGQNALVFNITKPLVDWIVGTEKRTRVDYRVLPRNEEEAKLAEVKTKTVKYISDTSKAAFALSLAFEDAAISGLGWIDHGIRSDPTEEPLFVRYEDWRNVWHDSKHKEKDGGDARYQIRSKIVDYDIAVAMFPDRADCITAEVNAPVDTERSEAEYGINPDVDELAGDADEDTDFKRDRVRLFLVEYRVPAKVKKLRGEGLGSLNGAIFEPENEGMQELVDGGHATLFDAIHLEMWVMIYCGKYVLQNKKRDYNHQRFSLVPIWGYKRKKDGTPYGAVEQVIDPQFDLNKRRSKALFILSSKQVIMEKDAVDSLDDFLDEKDRPDGTMIVNTNMIEKVKFVSDTQIAREHNDLMEDDKRYVESIAGVTDENRGLQTNATSGKAIKARQDQGHTQTAELFDNYRFSFLMSGEIILSLTEQYITDEKVIMITGEKGQQEFTTINKKMPDGSIENDITSTQARFVIDAENYHATIRQAMFESFGEMLTKLQPDVAIALLDMWVDLSDLPGKDVMVERIRAINGQKDPEEDPNDPEVKARMEAQEAEEARQKEIEDKLIELEMAMKEADINEKDATSEQKRADVEKKFAEIKKLMNDIKVDNEGVKVDKATVMDKIETRETAQRDPVETK